MNTFPKEHPQIPKYVLRAIQRRATAAQKFLSADIEIVKWLEKNDIMIDYCLTAAETLCEADGAMFGTITQIEEALKKASKK